MSMQINTSTPHISVKHIPFTPTVLMPGDPKRAEVMANQFLTDVDVISDVRGIKAYRGIYHEGKDDRCELTVMASGMGMPSIGIYSHELYNIFGVENIIRVGSAGAINKKLKLGDIVIAQTASTNSDYLKQINPTGHYAPCSDFELTSELAKSYVSLTGYSPIVGNILSTDTFYGRPNPNWEIMGVLCTEMESAALFTEAAMAGKRAATVCTISDLIFDLSQQMTAEERQNNLTLMMEVAFDAAAQFEKKSRRVYRG